MLNVVISSEFKHSQSGEGSQAPQSSQTHKTHKANWRTTMLTILPPTLSEEANQNLSSEPCKIHSRVIKAVNSLTKDRKLTIS